MQRDLKEQIAKLESHVDFLETELCYMNDLLLKCGFSEGLTSLKRCMEEYLTNSSFPEN